MTNPNQDDFDPLASFDSVPAVSFDPGRGGVPENVWVELEVLDYIKLVQAKDEQGRPKVFEDSGQPVMKAVIPVLLEGEKRSLWMKKNWVEGGLFRGLADAQRELGHRIGNGTKLAVRWHWDTSKPKKLGNHPKAYEVRASGGAPVAADPLSQPTTVATTAGPWAVPTAGGDEPPFLHRFDLGLHSGNELAI